MQRHEVQSKGFRKSDVKLAMGGLSTSAFATSSSLFLTMTSHPDILSLCQLHALTSGMKAFSTSRALGQVETCRLACGGHGFSAFSNLSELHDLISAGCTYEGENTVLMYLTPGALDVQLTPGVTSLPFNLTLVDTDDIVKANTEFKVMLSSSDPNVNVTQGDAIVRIQDNDKVLAGFTKLTESVDEESGFISLCVAVKVKSDIPLSVYVTTENEGTSSSDLQKLDKHQVMLLADRNVTCFNVTILDDDVPEGDEHFSVSLSSNDSRVTVDSGYSSIRVTIRDIKDKVTIQFTEPLIFVVSEGNSIPLKLNCTYHDIPFNVSLEISPNVFDTTADISDIVLTAIEFPAGVTNVTYNLATVADGKAESDEVMTLKIKSSVSWLVIGENDSIKAKITDEVDRDKQEKADKEEEKDLEKKREIFLILISTAVGVIILVLLILIVACCCIRFKEKA